MASIEFAQAHGKVDAAAIYIVVIRRRLHHFMRLHVRQVHARAMIASAAITVPPLVDVQHPVDQYGKDVDRCTGSSAEKLDLQKCRTLAH